MWSFFSFCRVLCVVNNVVCCSILQNSSTLVSLFIIIVVTEPYIYCCHICHECVLTIYICFVNSVACLVMNVCSQHTFAFMLCFGNKNWLCLICVHFVFAAFVVEKESPVHLSRWWQFTCSLDVDLCKQFSAAIVLACIWHGVKLIIITERQQYSLKVLCWYETGNRKKFYIEKI